MSIWNKAYEDFRSHYYGDIEEKKMSKEKHIKAAKAGKRWQDSDGDGKWYEKGEDVKEGVRDEDPEKGTAERKARLEKKRGMKMDDHPQYKKEEKEECPKCEGKGCDHCDGKGYHAEGMKQARKNVGASTCWKGYKAKGTKMKDGKEVPNCVKEEDLEEKKKGLWDNIHAKRKRGEKPAKPGDKDYPKTLNVEGYGKKKKKAKKEHADWRAEMGIVFEEGSCGSSGYAKKPGKKKNKITINPEVKTEANAGPSTPVKYDKHMKVMAPNMGAGRPGKVRLKDEVEVVEGKGMHRDAKTGEVVDKAEIGKTYYPNFPKKKTSVALRKEKESKKEEVEFAGNYEGPLYAPHPDLAEGGLQGAVDSITKKAQGALQRIGVKINKTPRPTARPSTQTQNTMRQNTEETEVSEGKKKKDDSYLETNMKKRHANNEKARKDMEKMGTKMKNPHFEETLLDKVVKGYVSEEDYDKMKDRRMERRGASNVASDKGIKKGPMSDADKKKSRAASKSAMDFVRAEIEKKYGKGAIMSKKKKDN